MVQQIDICCPRLMIPETQDVGELAPKSYSPDIQTYAMVHVSHATPPPPL